MMEPTGRTHENPQEQFIQKAQLFQGTSLEFAGDRGGAPGSECSNLLERSEPVKGLVRCITRRVSNINIRNLKNVAICGTLDTPYLLYETKTAFGWGGVHIFLKK